MPAFVDDHRCRRTDRCRPVRQFAVAGDQVSFASVSVRMPVCSPRTAAAAAEGRGRSPGRRLGSRPGRGRAWRWSCRRRRGDREPQTSPRCAHLPDQVTPAWAECALFAAISEQGQVDRRLNRRTAATCCCGEEALLGVEDPLRGVEAAPATVAPTSRRPAATLRVPRCRRAAGPGQPIDDRAPHRPTGRRVPWHLPRARRWCGLVVVLRLDMPICHVERLAR